MHVEIVAGHCEVQSRSFQTDKGAREAHEQPAYLHLPGAPFPLPFRLSLDSPASAYGPGTYVFSPDSVRTNNFGALEFNRFNMKLIKANIKGSDSQLRSA
jgi:hypothetical protein